MRVALRGLKEPHRCVQHMEEGDDAVMKGVLNWPKEPPVCAGHMEEEGGARMRDAAKGLRVRPNFV